MNKVINRLRDDCAENEIWKTIENELGKTIDMNFTIIYTKMEHKKNDRKLSRSRLICNAEVL